MPFYEEEPTNLARVRTSVVYHVEHMELVLGGVRKRG